MIVSLPVMLNMLILIRAGWRLLRVTFLLLAGVLCIALLYPLIGEQARAQIKRRWSFALLGALGISIARDGPSASQLAHGLLVANHISFVDIFVINALAPVTFVAKSDVANWPLFGWLTRKSGNLFIERGRRQAAHDTQKNITAALGAGHSIVIFPEGTTTIGDRVLPFHAALLQSAIAGAVPVICLALAYQTRVGKVTAAPAFVGEDTLWDCLWRIVTSDGIVARVRLAGDLSSVATDRRHLAHQAHQRIAHAMATLSAGQAFAASLEPETEENEYCNTEVI
jgi:1-acyl-sn-glycerol-3-phosphate acyltransferase